MLAESSDPSSSGMGVHHGGGYSSGAAGGDPNATAAWLTTPPPNSGPSVEQHEKELFAPYCTLDEPVRETIMRDVNEVWAKLKIVLLPLDRFAYPFQYMALASSTHDGSGGSNNNTFNGSGQPQQQQYPPSAMGQQQPQQHNMNEATPGGRGAAGVSTEDLTDNDRKVIQSLKNWDLWGPLILCLSLSVLLSLKAPKKDTSLVFAAVFCSVWAGGSVVTFNAQLLGGTISFFQSLCVMGYSTFPLVIAAFIIGCFKIIFSTWIWFDLLFIIPGFLWSVRVAAVFLGLYIKQERRFLALYPVFFFYTFLAWMILVF